MNLDAIESAKNAGLTIGTTLSDAYIAGYSLGAEKEAEAHRLTDGALQMEIELLRSILAVARMINNEKPDARMTFQLKRLFISKTYARQSKDETKKNEKCKSGIDKIK